MAGDAASAGSSGDFSWPGFGSARLESTFNDDGETSVLVKSAAGQETIIVSDVADAGTQSGGGLKTDSASPRIINAAPPSSSVDDSAAPSPAVADDKADAPRDAIDAAPAASRMADDKTDKTPAEPAAGNTAAAADSSSAKNKAAPAAVADTGKVEGDAPAAAKAAVPGSDAVKAEAVKVDAAKPDAVQADASKPDATKTASGKREAAEATSGKAADGGSADARPLAASKDGGVVAPAKAEANKADAGKTDAGNAEVGKADAGKAEPAKSAAPAAVTSNDTKVDATKPAVAGKPADAAASAAPGDKAAADKVAADPAQAAPANPTAAAAPAASTGTGRKPASASALAREVAHPKPAFYDKRAVEVLKSDEPAEIKDRLQADFPQHSMVSCVAGCGGGNAEVVYISRTSEIISATTGEVVPTSAEGAPAPLDNAITCVAGCYDTPRQRYHSPSKSEIEDSLKQSAARRLSDRSDERRPQRMSAHRAGAGDDWMSADKQAAPSVKLSAPAHATRRHREPSGAWFARINKRRSSLQTD